jgi:hypothetical protein
MQMKKKKETPDPAPLFFRIVDFNVFPKIRVERINFFGYALSVCFWVLVLVFVKQNCICIFFSDGYYIPWI